MSNTGSKRAKVPPEVEAAVLVKSGRRCSVCFAYALDFGVKLGQIAHLDHDPSNGSEDNLIFLCIPHHSEYDSTTSQHKNYTQYELKALRERLHRAVRVVDRSIHQRLRWTLSISASHEEWANADRHVLESKLRCLLNDPTLVVESIEEGSIVVKVNSTLESFLTAAAEAKSQAFSEAIGDAVSLPASDHLTVLRLTNTLFQEVAQGLGDSVMAAAIVESTLIQGSLLRPLPDASSRRIELVIQQVQRQFEDVFDHAYTDTFQHLPMVLRLLVMMAAVGLGPEEVGDHLGIDHATAETYLTLGRLAWRGGNTAVNVAH